jgi:predicted MFS family arabinose efflux permease
MIAATKSKLPTTESQQSTKATDKISLRSVVGLNAASFFLAEITGVVMPFLGAYLKGTQWSETAIGVAIFFAGLGVFLMQTPAGIVVDLVRQRRTLLAGASILLGLCYGMLPLVPAQPAWVDSPGRSGGRPPPLPQIRTCPIKAYGSSDQVFAAPP